MKTITLGQTANQEFDTAVDGVNYGFRLHLFRDLIYADVSVNNTKVVSSLRCIDRTWLIPFAYRNAGYGNFRFEDNALHYPNWQRFGNECNLVYYTNDEIAELEE